MTLLVRDEIDIVRENIEFHLDHGVDFVIVTDNGSKDGTREAVLEYVKAGVALLIDEPNQNYAQAEWVARMVKVAKEWYRADWCLLNDADEFWLPEDGNLKTEIQKGGANVLYVSRFNMLPVKGLGYKHFSAIHHKVNHKLSQGKVMCSTSGLNYICQGNHEVRMDNEMCLPSRNVVIYHYPTRSYEQMMKKVIQGGESYNSNSVLSKNTGIHWRKWYDLYQQGKFEETYNDLVLHQDSICKRLKEGSVCIDNTIQKYFTARNHTNWQQAPNTFYDRRFYRMQRAWKDDYHHVAQTLLKMLSFNSVMDVGCGSALVLEYLHKAGKTVKGVEMSRAAIHAAAEVIKDSIWVKDIRKPFFLGPCDLVICMEVAGHIGALHANEIINNVCRHAPKLVYFTSIAPCSKESLNYINIQEHEYWITNFARRNFIIDINATQWLRKQLAGLKHIRWIADSSMLFVNSPVRGPADRR